MIEREAILQKRETQMAENSSQKAEIEQLKA